MAILDMWTNVAKPSGTAYTNVDFSGKYTYDDISVLYDDPNVFYDGVNNSAWTNVAKPVSSVWTNVAKPT